VRDWARAGWRGDLTKRPKCITIDLCNPEATLTLLDLTGFTIRSDPAQTVASGNLSGLIDGERGVGPVFENLTEKLQNIFDKLARRGKLTEDDVNAGLREVRLALLEADVNYKVVKDFIARVKERAVGAEVMRSLTPAQQVIKIVHEELIATLGAPSKVDLSGPPPHVIMLVGLQGSGKTTTAAKLALRLRKSGQRPLLVAADTYRPAAITQLEILGRQLDIPVHSEGAKVPPPTICANAVKRAEASAYSVLIMEAGRLHIDDEMMGELERIKQLTRPQEVLLVADAMTRRCTRWGSYFHPLRHRGAHQVPGRRRKN